MLQVPGHESRSQRYWIAGLLSIFIKKKIFFFKVSAWSQDYVDVCVLKLKQDVFSMKLELIKKKKSDQTDRS